MCIYKLYVVVKFRAPSYNGFWDMNFYPVESWQTDRQKATHKSPPCNMHRWAQKFILGQQGVRVLVLLHIAWAQKSLETILQKKLVSNLCHLKLHRRTYRQKATHKSPLCMSISGLKNITKTLPGRWTVYNIVRVSVKPPWLQAATRHGPLTL